MTNLDLGNVTFPRVEGATGYQIWAGRGPITVGDIYCPPTGPLVRIAVVDADGNLIESEYSPIIREDGPTTLDSVVVDPIGKHHMGTTVDDLEALPVGSVVLDSEGDPWKKTDVDFWQCFEDSNDSHSLAAHWGPLTVLHVARD